MWPLDYLYYIAETIAHCNIQDLKIKEMLWPTQCKIAEMERSGQLVVTFGHLGRQQYHIVSAGNTNGAASPFFGLLVACGHDV